MKPRKDRPSTPGAGQLFRLALTVLASVECEHCESEGGGIRFYGTDGNGGLVGVSIVKVVPAPEATS